MRFIPALWYSCSVCLNYFSSIFSNRSQCLITAHAEYSLRRDWYEVDIEISEDQEELFTNEVIKDYFKHLLTDAIQKKEVMFFNQPAVFDGGWTVHNEPTLTALYEDSIDFFQKYYDGDLTYDAMTIQRRVIRQYEKGLI